MGRENSTDYLKDRLLSIDRVQADMFFPDRIEGECGWCGRKCYGIKGFKPDTCSYCFIELKSSSRVVDSLERLANVSHAVRWVKARKEEWTPRENTQPVRLDGSSFTNPVIEVYSTKKKSDRNYGHR